VNMGSWSLDSTYADPFKSRGSFWVCVVSNSRAVSECIFFLNKGIPCIMKIDGDRLGDRLISLISLWAKA
jgi:hypothetical protein